MDYAVPIGQSKAVVVHCAQWGVLTEQRSDALIYPFKCGLMALCRRWVQGRQERWWESG